MFPGIINVTLGANWTDAHPSGATLGPADVLTLEKVAGQDVWTEDGTDTPSATNRLRFEPTSTETFTSFWSRTATLKAFKSGSAWTTLGQVQGSGSAEYDFKDLWNSSFAFPSWANGVAAGFLSSSMASYNNGTFSAMADGTTLAYIDVEHVEGANLVYRSPTTATSQTIRITNIGGASMNWSAAANKAWAALSSASGSLAVGASTDLTLSFTDASIPDGQNDVVVTITDASAHNSGAAVTVVVMKNSPIARMAGASSGYLYTASPIATDIPISGHCWFYSDGNQNYGTIYSIGANLGSSVNSSFMLRVETAALKAIQYTAGGGNASTTAATITHQAWHHLAWKVTSAGLVTVWIDGVKTLDAWDSTVGAGDQDAFTSMRFGNSYTSNECFDGMLAYLGELSGAISDAEVAALAAGDAPTEATRYYDDLGGAGPHSPSTGSGDLTESGTVSDGESDPLAGAGAVAEFSADFGAADGLVYNETASPVSGYPLTIGMWLLTGDNTANLAHIGGSSSLYYLMFVINIITGRLQAIIRNGDDTETIEDVHAGSGAVATEAWIHAALAIDADGSVELFLDGTSVGTGTFGYFPGSLDRVAFGGNINASGKSASYSGFMAHPFIAKSRLPDAAIAAIAGGANPQDYLDPVGDYFWSDLTGAGPHANALDTTYALTEDGTVGDATSDPTVSDAVAKASTGGDARGVYMYALTTGGDARGQYAIALSTGGDARGTYVILEPVISTGGDARGIYAVGVLSTGGDARGQYSIALGAGGDARGQYAIALAAGGDARGIYATGIISTGGDARGTYGYLISTGGDARGTYSYTFSTGGDARGMYALANAALARYEVYVGTNADPDTTGAYTAAGASLPIDVNLSSPITPGTYYRVLVLRRNAYNLATQNVYYRQITIGAADAQVDADPSSPESATLTAVAGRKAVLDAEYPAINDGDNAGDLWVIYYTIDGTDPVVGTSPSLTQAIDTSTSPSRLLKLLGAYADGVTLKVKLAVRRSSDSAESDPTSTLTVTIDAEASLTTPVADVFTGTLAAGPGSAIQQ